MDKNTRKFLAEVARQSIERVKTPAHGMLEITYLEKLASAAAIECYAKKSDK